MSSKLVKPVSSKSLVSHDSNQEQLDVVVTSNNDEMEFEASGTGTSVHASLELVEKSNAEQEGLGRPSSTRSQRSTRSEGSLAGIPDDDAVTNSFLKVSGEIVGGSFIDTTGEARTSGTSAGVTRRPSSTFADLGKVRASLVSCESLTTKPRALFCETTGG